MAAHPMYFCVNCLDWFAFETLMGIKLRHMGKGGECDEKACDKRSTVYHGKGASYTAVLALLQ